MRIYPPTDYLPLNVTGGGIREFMQLFRQLRRRWVKVEFLQEYDESGFSGYEAFKRGYYEEAARLVREMVKSQDEIYSHARRYRVAMTRVRVCRLPLSSYLLNYEFAAYRADIECGEDIRFIDEREISDLIAETGISDFLVFDDEKVVALIYDLASSTLREARLVERPELVEQYVQVADRLIALSTPMLNSPLYLESRQGRRQEAACTVRNGSAR